MNICRVVDPTGASGTADRRRDGTRLGAGDRRGAEATQGRPGARSGRGLAWVVWVPHAPVRAGCAMVHAQRTSTRRTISHRIPTGRTVYGSDAPGLSVVTRDLSGHARAPVELTRNAARSLAVQAGGCVAYGAECGWHDRLLYVCCNAAAYYRYSTN